MICIYYDLSLSLSVINGVVKKGRRCLWPMSSWGKFVISCYTWHNWCDHYVDSTLPSLPSLLFPSLPSLPSLPFHPFPSIPFPLHIFGGKFWIQSRLVWRLVLLLINWLSIVSSLTKIDSLWTFHSVNFGLNQLLLRVVAEFWVIEN